MAEKERLKNLQLYFTSVQVKSTKEVAIKNPFRRKPNQSVH